MFPDPIMIATADGTLIHSTLSIGSLDWCNSSSTRRVSEVQNPGAELGVRIVAPPAETSHPDTQEEHKSIDMNVPDTPGSVHWGIWANGGAQWSGALPSETATYQIEWIDGWWIPS